MRVHCISDVDEVGRFGTCARCGRVKVRRKTNPNGSLRWACSVQEARWHKGNAARRWSAQEWAVRESLLREQGGRCGICAVPVEPGMGATDHDHDTDEIRGVLCSKCNLGLGHLGDGPELLRAALTYLGESC